MRVVLKLTHIAIIASLFSTVAIAEDNTNIDTNTDITAGKQKAIICANCHGEQGISEIELYPNLA